MSGLDSRAAAPPPALTLMVDDHLASVSWLSRAVLLAFPDTELMTAGSLASARECVQPRMPALALALVDLDHRRHCGKLCQDLVLQARRDQPRRGHPARAHPALSGGMLKRAQGGLIVNLVL